MHVHADLSDEELARDWNLSADDLAEVTRSSRGEAHRHRYASLLSNAALVWNTVRIGEVLAQLEKTGQPVTREELARISPLMRRHIIPNGTYSFESPRSRPHEENSLT